VVAARLATAGVFSPLTPRTFALIAVQRHAAEPAGLPGATNATAAMKPKL